MSPTQRATVHSRDPQKLVRTLANHWRHRFEIRRDEDGHAHVPFSADGGADFRVVDGALQVVLVESDPGTRARLREVIESHLRRFERDEALAFDWSAR